MATEFKQMNEDMELNVQETRRLIGPKSYNDNWNLINYTSELRDGKGGFFAFVDFNEYEGKITECPHCLEYEIHNRLKPRMLEKGEVKHTVLTSFTSKVQTHRNYLSL